MLGSVFEAEEVVQKAFLRLHRTQGVDHPGQWLTRGEPAVPRPAPGVEAHTTHLNGTLGLVYHQVGRLFAVVSLDVAGGRVAGVNFVVNPDKLRHLRLPGGAAILTPARPRAPGADHEHQNDRAGQR